MKMSVAFHGGISLNQQKKIPKILKLMQFPCADALSYSHFAEGKLDVVIQCSNKIWDIHPSNTNYQSCRWDCIYLE
jgi:fructose-1,6-bisphosphatase/inositol monophosphatase family enzyme